MALPQVGTTRPEKLALSFVTDAVYRDPSDGGLGFIYRNQPEADKGVDGHIEVCDDGGAATGKLVGTQVKGGPTFFKHPVAGGWVVYIKKPTVTYWRGYSLAVILVIVDLKERVGYWALVSQGDFEETKKFFRNRCSVETDSGCDGG